MIFNRSNLAAFSYRKMHHLSVLVVLAGLGSGSILAQKTNTVKPKPFTTWDDFMGSPQSMQYSALTQINKSNIKDLQVAWTYETGDQQTYNFTPLIAHGVAYIMGKSSSIVAVDATNGKEIWSYPTSLQRYRGVNYWESADGSDRRILIPDNNYLLALDARTGRLIASFGDNGKVDLKVGLGRDTNKIPRIQPTSPGRVFENLIILGSGTGERYDSPPGDLRAYDARTGKLAWQFHTIPHKGEVGYDSWPTGAPEVSGGANIWGEMSIDPDRGILYGCLGAPGYNFYGGEREGKNLFGDSMVAVDARTGKLLWYYQLIHHDVWDLDSPAGPKLLTITHDGKKVDVVAEAAKQGWVYVFDRVTGKPIWPIVETPVPQSSAGHEQTFATQPIPSAPPAFTAQVMTVKDVNPYMDDDEKAHWTEVISKARNDVLPNGTDTFTPPEIGHDSVSVPGNHGGANWGMVAGDPTKGTLYVESLTLPSILRLIPTLPSYGSNNPAVTGQGIVATRCATCHGESLKGAPPSIPALDDALGRMSTDDLKKIVKEGRGSMPSFGDFTEQQLNGIAAYLQNPAAVPPPRPVEPEKVDAQGIQDHYYSGFGFFFPRNGTSIMRPPWVTLTAYDLNTGTIEWQIPVGDDPGLAKQGIHNTGAGGVGATGAITVAAGMVLIGNTRDQVLRAIDADTGKTIWEYKLPLVSGGGPAVYEVNGKEYILMSVTTAPGNAAASGGGGGAGRGAATSVPRSFIAFSLPAKTAEKK
jgi:quinoprotein glucose dehydrogenase